MAPKKKVKTEDKYIDRAQDALGVVYPQVLRDKLKTTNGFMWGYFERFYPVLDDDDKFHTFDDVVKENNNPNGWKNVLPEGYVAIADDAGRCALLLSTKKDGKVYHFNYDTWEVTLFAKNDEELSLKLEEQEEELKKIYSDS